MGAEGLCILSKSITFTLYFTDEVTGIRNRPRGSARVSAQPVGIDLLSISSLPEEV
jgi:hypothetical protein